MESVAIVVIVNTQNQIYTMLGYSRCIEDEVP